MTVGADIYTVAACLAVCFFVYSFAGWLWEVVYTLAVKRKFVNRGFLFGPICPIYGVGGLLAIVVVGQVPGVVAQFVVGGVLATVVEYVTSWVLERLFGARWWDYSDFPLNINGRVCLFASLAFAVMMVAVNQVFQPALAGVMGLLPQWVLHAAAIVMSIALVADVAASVAGMNAFNRKLEAVQRYLSSFGAGAVMHASQARERVAGGWERVSELAGRAEGAAQGVFDRIQGEVSLLVDQVLDIIPERMSLIERKVLNDPMFCEVRLRQAFDYVCERLTSGFALPPVKDMDAREPEADDGDSEG